MLNMLKDFVCRDLPKPVDRKSRLRMQENLVRRIVATLSRGNVSLQSGRFITASQIKRLKAENMKHKFSET